MKTGGLITFDPELKSEILDMFGMIPDKDGYIIKKDSPYNMVTNQYGDRVHINDFAGIKKGKRGNIILIKSDIVSLIKLTDELNGD